MQRYFDRFVFGCVKLWVLLTAYPHWRALRMRLRKKGIRRVRVVVPRLWDEKFLWRKLFDHDPRFVTLSDKIDCKEWVAAQGFDVLTPQTLWVGADANDIPDALWNRPTYLKGAHGYQMNIPLLAPPADRAAVIAQANAFVAREHGRATQQWAYRHVKKRLLLEEALFVDKTMIEVKYYTNGPIVEQFVITRRSDPVVSARWLRQIAGGYARDDRPTTHGPHIYTDPLPPVVKKGLKLASEIGSHFDQMRVDTLTDGETMYLGELTVYNQAGHFYLQGHLVDTPVNRTWDIRNSWFMTSPQRWPWSLYVGALRRALDRRDARRAAKASGQ